ncbi:uncharacterized protein LOC143134569 isoform X2 [Alosa pseudoharengus]|uniref:uncharacterized protein LOC143134569 isoform X2 n=1 Tax=Alosa pseudoharengus TaxID=34774 RepID=UPI003F8CBB75
MFIMAEPERRPKRRFSAEEVRERKKASDRARNRTRINIGRAYKEWRELRESKACKTDADLAFLLMKFHVGAGEVVVQLECLLQLFQRCFECCSTCSIRKRREGRFLNVTQKCQQCQASRKWRSHPPEQINPTSNQEVAEETVLLSFGDSDTGTDEEVVDRSPLNPFGETESVGEDEVQVQDSLSQLRKDNEEDKEIQGLHHVNSSKDSSHIKTEKEETLAFSHGQLEFSTFIQKEEHDARSLAAEAELAPNNTSVEVNDSVIHTPEATVNRLNGREEDGEETVVKMEMESDDEANVQTEGEDGDEDGEEEEDEQGEEELEMQDSDDEEYGGGGGGEHEEDDDDDDDWHPVSEGWKQLSAPESDSRSRPNPDSEPEVLLPLAWCSVCGSGFKHDCFRQRHSRLYGCLRCGTKRQMEKDGEVAEVTTTNNNQETGTNQEPSICNTQTVSDGGRHKNTCGSKQCIASDGNQDSVSANKEELTTSNGSQEASSITDCGNGTVGTLYIDIHGQTRGSHTEITQNGHQGEASSRNPDKEHSWSLHIDNLAVLFKSLNDFKIHAMQWHGITQFRELCTDCGKFINMVNMVDGGPSHVCEHKAKPIVCPSCGKRFATEVGLRTHSDRIHSEKYSLTCRYCLEAFKSPEDKEEHEESHEAEVLKYHCPDCSLRFSDRPSWCAHRKSHWPNGKHICEVCNKGFRSAGVLIRHMAIHTGQKPYSCKLCDRSFNQPGHLKSHMRLHTGERPFKCQDCGQCFNHNVSLKNHIQRHHGPGADKRNSGKGRKDRMRRKKRNS